MEKDFVITADIEKMLLDDYEYVTYAVNEDGEGYRCRLVPYTHVYDMKHHPCMDIRMLSIELNNWVTEYQKDISQSVNLVIKPSGIDVFYLKGVDIFIEKVTSNKGGKDVVNQLDTLNFITPFSEFDTTQVKYK